MTLDEEIKLFQIINCGKISTVAGHHNVINDNSAAAALYNQGIAKAKLKDYINDNSVNFASLINDGVDKLHSLQTKSGTFDLKLGYSCNNNCVHCVIRTNREALIERKQSIDDNYVKVIHALNSEQAKQARDITITGGEPTLRKDFIYIMRYAAKHYSDKTINLQTNGRLLSRYIPEIASLGVNIGYVIALHGKENIHNMITRSKTGSPYRETMESIEMLSKYYGDIDGVMRIEIVLSRYNLAGTPDFVEYLYSQGIKHIGISYPHLDGIASKSIEEAMSIGFPYAELKPVLYDLYNIAVKNEDIKLEFEKVPACMWRDNEDRFIGYIDNIRSMDPSAHTIDVTIKFPQSEPQSFNETYRAMHRKPSVCSKCAFDQSCMGVWEEAVLLYGDQGFTPVTKEEADGWNSRISNKTGATTCVELKEGCS
jgi:MoaA/NifB/PqqE/SkfB family radical SAM enzyme